MTLPSIGSMAIPKKSATVSLALDREHRAGYPDSIIQELSARDEFQLQSTMQTDSDRRSREDLFKCEIIS